MTGLILKDLINLKKQARVYLILVLFYLVLGIANESSDMFSTMMIVVSAIIPITAMSYDERSKWDRYALTMPLSRKSMVASKYILGLIFLVASFILSMLFNSFFSNISLMENVMICLATLSIGMVIMSVIFPLIFKFGVEKARTQYINIPENDFYVGRWWNVCIKFIGPGLIIIMFIWWTIQAISWYPETWWNPFLEDSLGTAIVQGALIVLISLIFNKKIAKSSGPKYFKDDGYPDVPEEHLQ